MSIFPSEVDSSCFSVVRGQPLFLNFSVWLCYLVIPLYSEVIPTNANMGGQVNSLEIRHKREYKSQMKKNILYGL